MNSNFYYVYGFSEQKVIQNMRINRSQLADFIDNILKIFRYYSQIENIFNSKKLIQHQTVHLKDLFQIIQSKHFIQLLPLLVNSRFTSINLKLIKASLILYKLQLLDKLLIPKLICNFQLVQQSSTNILMNLQNINKILKMTNRILCRQVYDLWMQKCAKFLKSPQYVQIDEFLYLAANSIQKIQIISKFKRSKKTKQQNQNFMSKIHLDETLLGFMSQQLKSKKLIYVGKQQQKNFEKFGQTLFNNLFQKSVRRQIQIKEKIHQQNLLNGIYIRNQIQRQIEEGEAIFLQQQNNSNINNRRSSSNTLKRSNVFLTLKKEGSTNTKKQSMLKTHKKSNTFNVKNFLKTQIQYLQNNKKNYLLFQNVKFQ